MEPTWATSGGQLLTLLGAAVPAGEEEQPGSVPDLIHYPQAWLRAAALHCLPEHVTGNPLTCRLQEGGQGEQDRPRRGHSGHFLESFDLAEIADHWTQSQGSGPSSAQPGLEGKRGEDRKEREG
jgi:hypothetical protein